MARDSIQVGALKESEVPEAVRIMKIAFGTFLGVPNPLEFMGDRDFLTPRHGAKHVKALAARDGDRLIGSNLATRWGSFGFFGPLTILPEYWNRGVAQKLLDATMKAFSTWGVRHTGLFTFAASAKHVGLYQKFGYWPRFLTAIMTRTPEKGGKEPTLLSALSKSRRGEVIEACGKLTDKLDKGLDLSDEIRTALAKGVGDVALTYTRAALDGFAVCMRGPGSEGGEKVCYVKFAAARSGAGAGERFSKLLEACDALASARGAAIEAGVNLAREDAYRRMRAHGYRASMQGVAMHRPNGDGFNRGDAYVLDDWR
jgi:GNAT superfamily N-acetyltransferase